MNRSFVQSIAVVACLIVAWPGYVASQDPPIKAKSSTEAKPLDGLWAGSWGGGMRGGVAFQPVIAELVVRGDQFELTGFRGANQLSGTIHVDAKAKRIKLTPAASPGKPAPKAIEYAYEIKGDVLTVIDEDKEPVTLNRAGVLQNPLADVRVELVTVSEIDKTGRLLVTEITELRAGKAGGTFHQPRTRALSTEKATVLLVQESGWKKLTVDEARRLVREPTPVAIAFRTEERHQFESPGGLWKDAGPVQPDHEAASRMFLRLLRPGTIVFILPAREGLPQP